MTTGNDTTIRAIGRELARELTPAELDAVSGGQGPLVDNNHNPSSGGIDHTQTGNPCQDCD